jgi:hypothetical protein
MKKPIVMLILAVVFIAPAVFATPPPVPTPDAGSTGLLLSAALGAIGLGRRFFRR